MNGTGNSAASKVLRWRARAAPFAKRALLRGGGYAAIRRLLPSRSVAILRYHAICNENGYAYADSTICISPEAFESHVRYLAANYAVLPMPEVVDRWRACRPLPKNAVVITFDDGYADNLEAARTLNRHGLTATFFITAGCLADGEPFWPSELRALITSLRGSSVRILLNGELIEQPITNDTERHRAVRKITRLFKSHPIPVREDLRCQLRDAAGLPVAASACMLRWEDVAEMQRLGMTIGAHTLTHPNLPSAGLEAATREIAGSKRRLQEELGHPVTMFSYPNGGTERHYTPELQRIVASCGFAASASSRNGFADASSDLFALERVEVEESLEELVFALEVERFVLTPR